MKCARLKSHKLSVSILSVCIFFKRKRFRYIEGRFYLLIWYCATSTHKFECGRYEAKLCELWSWELWSVRHSWQPIDSKDINKMCSEASEANEYTVAKFIHTQWIIEMVPSIIQTDAKRTHTKNWRRIESEGCDANWKFSFTCLCS